MKVAAVHGIGNRFEGRDKIAANWLPALNSGLHEAGFKPISPEEFSAVFYGSVFRPSGARGAAEPLDKEGEEWCRQLALVWYEETARLSERNRSGQDPLGEDPRIQSPQELLEGRARTPSSLQSLLRLLSKSRFFRALHPETAMAGDLREVYLFLHKPAVKQAVLQRCAEAIDADTQVVIGHSLGSVVAYEALCQKDTGWQVNTLVTLGSPLGIQNLVFDALTPKPNQGRAQWPNIRNWVNIADAGDIVALEKRLARYFGPVKDRPVYNGWHSHDALRYLTARETGSAVGEGLNH
jgi:hypothetical protein